jgi:hypothetical protein
VCVCVCVCVCVFLYIHLYIRMQLWGGMRVTTNGPRHGVRLTPTRFSGSYAA